jgi:hypothetical protein
MKVIKKSRVLNPAFFLFIRIRYLMISFCTDSPAGAVK